MATFLQSLITNFRIINIDCLNNDWKCTLSVFIKDSIKYKMSSAILYAFLWLFFIAFVSFLFPFFCSLFLSNLFKTHRKNLGKGSYQTLNILLFLAVAIDAVVCAYSKRKSLSLCNFATFYFFKILCFFCDVRFHSWNGIILLLQHTLNLRSIFPSPVLNCEPLSNTFLARFCKGDKKFKKVTCYSHMLLNFETFI